MAPDRATNPGTAAAALLFPTARAANFVVAGIPAAARAVHAATRRPGMIPDNTGIGSFSNLIVAVPGGWTPSRRCLSEIRRLVPDLEVAFADSAALPSSPAGLLYEGATALRGESPRPLEASALSATAMTDGSEEAACLARLREAGRRIVASTGKPTDGIVSRHVNRPISRAITRAFLLVPGIAPIHATLVTAALGLMMALCLFFGGEKGLVAGAILFQAASIFDGVDGEMARATFRSSELGAKLDSLTDAATNLAFIAGLCVNLFMQGEVLAASIGIAGLAMFAAGLAALGLRAARQRGAFTFDAAKHFALGRNSRFMKILTWITMRDFFAALGAVLVISGYASTALILFSGAVFLWLIFVLAFLAGLFPAASSRTPEFRP